MKLLNEQVGARRAALGASHALGDADARNLLSRQIGIPAVCQGRQSSERDKGFNLSLNLRRAGKQGRVGWGGGEKRKKLKRRREIRSQRNGRNQEDLAGESLNSAVGLWGMYSDAGSQDRRGINKKNTDGRFINQSRKPESKITARAARRPRVKRTCVTFQRVRRSIRTRLNNVCLYCTCV